MGSGQYSWWLVACLVIAWTYDNFPDSKIRWPHVDPVGSTLGQRVLLSGLLWNGPFEAHLCEIQIKIQEISVKKI